MTDENKQPEEFKITKKGLLTIAIIGLVILIVGMIVFYFFVTITYIKELNTLSRILSVQGEIDESHKWWMILFARLISLQEPINMRNVLLGIAGVLTLIFAWRRLIIADQQKDSQIKQTEYNIKQIEIESDRRLSERFDTAVATLSKKLYESSFPAHLGAISGLRELATDSPENTQRCLDIICSCNQWMEEKEYIDKFIMKGSQIPYSALLLNEDNRIDNKGDVTLLQEKRSQAALVAISNILTKISTNNPKLLKELKFHNKMLCGISLNNITLDGIDFQNTYLVAAKFDGVSLNKAKLNRSHLDMASLKGIHLLEAELQRASLLGVDLQGAFLDYANLQGASLDYANLQGASLDYANLWGASLPAANLQGASLLEANLQGASLMSAKFQGASLMSAKLQEALLVNTKLQGATMNKVDLSYAILLDCNLYCATLKEIKGKNIIFNEIVNVGYIENKRERMEWLSNICYYLKSNDKKSFVEKMEAAWEAMENSQEPDGLGIIRKSSIVTKDNQGIYDISKENLTKLKIRLKEQDNERGINFLRNMRFSLSSIGNDPSNPESQMTDKHSNLVNKLVTLIDELIEDNENERIKKIV